MHYKLLLADDHHLLLQGISSVLNEMPGVSIVGTAQNGYEAIEMTTAHLPDLVILDLNMPGFDGLKCLQKIKQSHPAIKVLVLTNYNQPELVEQVRKLNAQGYLNKNTSSYELKEAIQQVLDGHLHFPEAPAAVPNIADTYFFDQFLKKYQLTKREVEIIRLICEERTSKEIANILFLSELTISTHRKNILRKLDLKNVAGLINFARQNNLIEQQ